ncbi:MAG: ATP-binding protein [Gammaproteobacteria bacterium]|nr:ATP-binding protein [Gammaproteobacteria bacterium]MCY4227174.1 ATP-binding protein [Gammaproteobacteria bacterium]
MNEGQERGLKSFLQQTEGTPPPVFVGRAGVLADIALAAEQVWEGTGAGMRGMEKATRIVQGAPGAGKSSTLNEIARNPERLRMEGGTVPMVLMLKSGDIQGPRDILRPLAEKVHASKSREFMARISRNTGGEAGFGLGLLRFARKKEIGIEHAEPGANWGTFGAWAEQHGGFDRPIILAIDEAQRFDHFPEDPLSKLFQGLHDGCGLPVALVLAGLSDTEYSAGKMDLTRIPTDQKHNIGRFPDHEAEELMVRSCAHFGIGIAGFEHEVEQLARPCEGWPRHLHIALKALGRGALMTGGDLGEVGWRTVSDNIMASREAYYASQQSEQMEVAARLTASVMSGLDTGINRAGVIGLIEKNIGEQPSDRLPAGIKTAEEFLIHLLHRGALQRDAQKLYACPIPSFRAYLLEQGGMAQNPSPILKTT